MSQQKRRSERIDVVLEVRWLRLPYPIALRAVDVNLHGLFLATDETVQPDALMQIEVVLPDGPLTMFVRARFVGRTSSGCGIGAEMFLMDEPARARWSAFYRGALARRRAERRRQELGAAASIE